MTDQQRVEEIRELRRSWEAAGLVTTTLEQTAIRCVDELLDSLTAVDRELDEYKQHHQAMALALSDMRVDQDESGSDAIVRLVSERNQAQADLAELEAQVKELQSHIFDPDLVPVEKVVQAFIQGEQLHYGTQFSHFADTRLAGVVQRARQDGAARVEADRDRLRALLILAYDMIGTEAAGPNAFDLGLGKEQNDLLRGIIDAVSTTGQVTEADVLWAREQVVKHSTDSPHAPPQ